MKRSLPDDYQTLISKIVLREGAFHDKVMQRDSCRCVICGRSAEGVIHLLDSRLWDDGSDQIGNGVTLCAHHCYAAIMTDITLEDLRIAAGITELSMPQQMYTSTRYDRWGNPLMPEGRRARGDLFGEPDVQECLKRASKLDSFVTWVKYPRTYVLPWSPTKGEGDRWMSALTPFEGKRVIVTEKMDGENVSLYCDHRHTRSLHRINHPSRHWLDAKWEAVRHGVPHGWRICAEYLFVTHSIVYEDLNSYLHAFSVWNDGNTCLAWDETRLFLEKLEIETATVLYDGLFDRNAVHDAWVALGSPQSEGYVVRLASSFHISAFRHCVGKYIRSGYQQSDPLQAKVWHPQSLGNRS
jgi:hypothetical protein